jgi:dTDP-4-dehydrorhamnose 3,5-epimerase
MVQKTIDGVRIKLLRLLPDDRGWLMEILRSDWEEYDRFGQVYVTAVYPGVVKAWHYHKVQTDHFSCISGMAKVVLYDGRKDSLTHGQINEFYIGELNPLLIKIPPLVHHGFRAVSDKVVLIVNVPTHLYNYKEPDEFRLPYDAKEIGYDWSVQSG